MQALHRCQGSITWSEFKAELCPGVTSRGSHVDGMQAIPCIEYTMKVTSCVVCTRKAISCVEYIVQLKEHRGGKRR